MCGDTGALFEDLKGEYGGKIRAFDIRPEVRHKRQWEGTMDTFKKPFSSRSLMHQLTGGGFTPTEKEREEFEKAEKAGVEQHQKNLEKKEQEEKAKLQREELLKASKRKGRSFFTKGSLKGQISSGTSPLFDSAFGN